MQYGCFPSPAKPLAALDTSPLCWKSDGPHEPLFEAAKEPTTAVALVDRRQKCVMRAAEAGHEEPRPSDIDVWPIVVRHGIRNTHDNQQAHLRLIAVARQTCSPAMVTYLFRIRRRLPSLIDDVWTWEEVHDLVALSQKPRMVCLLESRRQPCCCGGLWLPFVETSLRANGIDACVLAHDFHESILKGRCETVPVIALAGQHGGEGKSIILDPIIAVFGEEYVQEGLASGQFPLLGLESKKAVILNEWNFLSSALSGAV
jgi:hypothetical protein